ncbi:hypothetical protein Fmac_003343 [Flemingia macrophylla]|uniref:Uncharacterized protein n=1 Tax=Flemingia macrophylla TaxID=520843 RepID=A0ABD1NN85_9FABA
MGSRPPRVLVSGVYVHGPDEVRQLHESGELERFIEHLSWLNQICCDCCGGFRFLMSDECNGSCGDQVSRINCDLTHLDLLNETVDVTTYQAIVWGAISFFSAHNNIVYLSHILVIIILDDFLVKFFCR